MKRLTSDDTKSIFYSLNLFFAKDNEVWIRGGGPEPDYQDCTLVNWIGRVADKHNLEIHARNAEDLGDEMYDCLQYGIDTIEGVVALLHAAAVQATTMRSRLKEIEDILGDDYDLDRLKELVEADKEGKAEMFPCKPGEEIWVIERDDYGDALGFSCCVFVAKSENYVIASSHIYQCEGAKEILKCLNEQTAIEYNCEMLVYPADDCYLDKQSAEAALEKMKEDDE